MASTGIALSNITFRPGTRYDSTAIVALNEPVVTVTSPMDIQRFHSLFEMCSLVTVAEIDDRVVGFLMGFSEGAAYDSANYRWFSQRLKNFFYVDRIVIARGRRGLGLGQQFYARVRSWAQDNELGWIAAEMNLEPPNVASLRFHERNGFVQIGTHKLASGKVVSMQVCSVG